jgi:hypothetical protein
MLLAELIEEMDDVPQPLEVQQGEVMSTRSCWEPWLLTVVGPAHGNRCMRAIAKADHQVRIGTLADTDDFTALTAEGVMGMGDGHRFQRRLGYRCSLTFPYRDFSKYGC